MKIRIPYDPPNWNEYINAERRNRYIAAKLKKDEKMIVRAAVHGKKWKGGYPVALTVRAHFQNRRKDLDNTRVKGIIDGLVEAGVIQDDSLRYVQKLIILPVFDRWEGIEIDIKELDYGESETGSIGDT